MKLTRITESDGQKLNPENFDSFKYGVSRRGFITTTGIGIGLAAVVINPRRLTPYLKLSKFSGFSFCPSLSVILVSFIFLLSSSIRFYNSAQLLQSVGIK
jgi:hypothetical protein